MLTSRYLVIVVAALTTPACSDREPQPGDIQRRGSEPPVIWVEDVRHDGSAFVGRIGNVPTDLATVKLGDEVTVAPTAISDWMMIDDGRLIGGYTIRLLRSRLSDAERREFDASVPFDFD